MDIWESLAGNYLRKLFQCMECEWMESCSTGRLKRSELEHPGNAPKVRTEVSFPTSRPLDNTGSLIVNIVV